MESFRSSSGCRNTAPKLLKSIIECLQFPNDDRPELKKQLLVSETQPGPLKSTTELCPFFLKISNIGNHASRYLAPSSLLILSDAR